MPSDSVNVPRDRLERWYDVARKLMCRDSRADAVVNEMFAMLSAAPPVPDELPRNDFVCVAHEADLTGETRKCGRQCDYCAAPSHPESREQGETKAVSAGKDSTVSSAGNVGIAGDGTLDTTQFSNLYATPCDDHLLKAINVTYKLKSKP